MATDTYCEAESEVDEEDEEDEEDDILERAAAVLLLRFILRGVLIERWRRKEM